MPDPGKGLLDGIEAAALSRPLQEMSACRTESFAHDPAVAAGEVAFHQHVTGWACRRQNTLDTNAEDITVQRVIEDTGHIDAVKTQDFLAL